MNRQPVNQHGFTQTLSHRKTVAGGAFMVGLIACVPAAPDPTDKIAGRIPMPVRPTQQILQTYLTDTAAEIRR